MHCLRILHVEDSGEDALLCGRACEGEGAAACFVKPENFETIVRIAESFGNIVTDGLDKNEQTT